MTQESDTPNIHIPNFRKKILEHLKELHCSIEATKDQKEIIWLKALEVLDKFISRSGSNEYTIPKNANLKNLAATIIYTVIISNKNIPKISTRQISKLFKIKSNSIIPTLYSRYFKKFYPRIEFLTSVYKVTRIKRFISLYFFNSLSENIDLEISGLILQFKDDIMKNNKISSQLTYKDRKEIQNILIQYPSEFIKYFTDIAEVVKQLIISSKVYKKIGAHLVIKYLADFLEEKGVNLFQKSKGFSMAVIDIFDFLRSKFPDFFPIRTIQKNVSKKEEKERLNEYRKIVGSKLKLYLVKNIYNGKYVKNGNISCPECKKKNFKVNTNISRLNALEFHHNSDKKENEFGAVNLYRIFASKQSNPNVLDDLVKLFESEKVVLICRNHHFILHDKYYKYFKYLINWEDIFLLFPEIIHILVMIAIDNFRLTKNLTKKEKQQIKSKILRKLKKKYIIEKIYGGYCPTCGEFNTTEHLSAFSFHHQDGESKKYEASQLFHLSCSEIVQRLQKENGGYICPNCHSVFHYTNIHLLDKIYEDKNTVKKIIRDYDNIRKKFTLIRYDKTLIKNPLKTDIKITGNIEMYLTGIYKISELKNEVNSIDLADYLGLTRQDIYDFFKRNNFIKKYINIIMGTLPNPFKYSLTDEGKKIISLMLHFKDYYLKKR